MNVSSFPPAANTVVYVKLWGLEWPCSFLGPRVSRVSINGRWMDARHALRDSLCDALEAAFAAMEETC